MNALDTTIRSCTKCVLRSTCREPIPGDGNPEASIMIIGEAPGAEEDKQGVPFVGRSGKLLTSILEWLGYVRATDYYITNIVKCRPPENRDPTPVELATCHPYLVEQILTYKPKLIVTLGRFSFNFLVPGITISEWRGNVYPVNEIQWVTLDYTPIVLAIYHPAVALYNPSKKTIIVQDLAKISSILEKA